MKAFIILMSLMKLAIAGPEIVLSPLEHLYVPKGFDSNDSVEVIVTGYFPNPCYSRNNVEVSVNDALINITVTALEPEMSSRLKLTCPDMIVPFKEVVSIGNLQGGNYKIVVNGLLKDSLQVDESTSSAVDEHIYAAVDWIEKKTQNEFILHTTLYSPCFKLDRIEVISNSKDTLSILPVMKQISQHCPMKGVPVNYPVRLDFTEMKVNRPLLHVRTLDGKSVNAIVDLEGR